MIKQRMQFPIAVFLVLVSLIAFPLASRAGDNVWTTTGPYGLQIAGLYIDPRNEQVMYATNTYGTTPIYKSTDGGVTWRVSSTGIANIGKGNASANYDMAFDKDNSNILYITMSDGLYRSVNGGMLWERKSKFVENGQLREIGPVASVAVSPRDGTVYIGASFVPSDIFESGGIFRSTDKGETWEWLAELHGKTGSSGVAVGQIRTYGIRKT